MESTQSLACSICKQNYHDGLPQESRLAVTKCGHIFHRNCITHWWTALSRRHEVRRCPLCNVPSRDREIPMDIYPTLQPNDNTLIADQNTTRNTQLTQQLQQKLIEANKMIDSYRQKLIDAVTKVRTLEEQLDIKINETWELEFKVECLDEMRIMGMDSDSDNKRRIDELQQRCDRLSAAFNDRTKKFFDKMKQHGRSNQPVRGGGGGGGRGGGNQ